LELKPILVWDSGVAAEEIDLSMVCEPNEDFTFGVGVMCINGIGIEEEREELPDLLRLRDRSGATAIGEYH
jgi:hypothetical protein